jgi:AraC family transcriptional regulator, regulatory protein of adaptative response / methylated-DNA-[protein]-cysteine methyltransferase
MITTLLNPNMTPRVTSHPDQQKWEAVLRRDRTSDGQFVFGVSSTGIYCRPSCPSRRPRRENVSFYMNAQDAQRAGLRACLRCKPDSSSALPEFIELARTLLERDADVPLTLSALAAKCRVSPFHLQREFKRSFGVSPKEYRRAIRMKEFKGGVRKAASVTEAMFDAGFASSRSFYENAGDALGMTPSSYKRGAASEVLRWAIFATKLGRMVAIGSSRGLCSLEFVDDEAGAEEFLHKEYPRATLVRDQDAMATTIAAVRSLVESGLTMKNIPLDLRGTAFQLAVWNYLRNIPPGETRSYTEVARGIRQPTAVRAVARACATNRIAVVVPCHRVVRSGGEISGYKWGPERKKKLLASERKQG